MALPIKRWTGKYGENRTLVPSHMWRRGLEHNGKVLGRIWYGYGYGFVCVYGMVWDGVWNGMGYMGFGG
jgi:hypothetical protein